MGGEQCIITWHQGSQVYDRQPDFCAAM